MTSFIFVFSFKSLIVISHFLETSQIDFNKIL